MTPAEAWEEILCTLSAFQALCKTMCIDDWTFWIIEAGVPRDLQYDSGSP